jgi:hypothetical protein
MDDTHPDIRRLFDKMLMNRSGAERLIMGCGMFETARSLVLASIPAGISGAELKRRLCERIYGDEVDQKAFARRLASGSSALEPQKSVSK